MPDNCKKENKESDVEQETTEIKSPRKSATRSRKLTVFVSLDLWMVLLMFFVYNIHVNSYEKIEARLNIMVRCSKKLVIQSNLNQLWIGEGDSEKRRPLDIEECLLTQLEEVNAEIDELRETLIEAMEEFAKKDERFQEIVFNNIDRDTRMLERLIEDTTVQVYVQDFIQEATAKKISLIHSFSFFFTFIFGHWFGLTKISKQYTNQFVMFLVIMLGNIHMFLFTIPVYNSVLAPFLGHIHPDSLALSALL